VVDYCADAFVFPRSPVLPEHSTLGRLGQRGASFFPMRHRPSAARGALSCNCFASRTHGDFCSSMCPVEGIAQAFLAMACNAPVVATRNDMAEGCRQSAIRPRLGIPRNASIFSPARVIAARTQSTCSSNRPHAIQQRAGAAQFHQYRRGQGNFP